MREPVNRLGRGYSFLQKKGLGWGPGFFYSRETLI
jgi:hypothetical protein